MKRNLSPSVLAGAMARARTRDHQTFDAAMLATAPITPRGDHQGARFEHAYKTHDAYTRPNADGSARTVDSSGAFLVGELERLDQTLHLPLAAVTWSRDIQLRTDVSLADEMSSFSLTAFGSAGNLGAGNGILNGKAWIGKSTDQIGGVGVDTGKSTTPLTPWGLEVKFTVLELESAAKMGRPIDDQKFEALKLKHQMDIDEMVYVGDSNLNLTGLLNNSLATNVSNVPNGASASPLWANKTPAEILADINNMLTSTWQTSAYAVMPRNVLLPPLQFGYISTQVVSSAGNVSILEYVLKNNIITASGQGNISIKPAKWAVGAGAGGTLTVANGHDRMCAYTNEKQFVRYPMTTLQRTPIQFDSIFHKSTYYCRLGGVELVYPETIAYRDGI